MTSKLFLEFLENILQSSTERLKTTLNIMTTCNSATPEGYNGSREANTVMQVSHELINNGWNVWLEYDKRHAAGVNANRIDLVAINDLEKRVLISEFKRMPNACYARTCSNDIGRIFIHLPVLPPCYQQKYVEYDIATMVVIQTSNNRLSDGWKDLDFNCGPSQGWNDLRNTLTTLGGTRNKIDYSTVSLENNVTIDEHMLWAIRIQDQRQREEENRFEI